jgi:SAM-dependent methyltransferase
MKRVLNVGANSKKIPMPAHYDASWEPCFLDIDARHKPDILCDARELTAQQGAQFDGIYCSHNLEHYYPHDVKKVLAGFLHVLIPSGFAEVLVPDIRAVAEAMLKHNYDIDEPLYQSSAGPISARDVIYGYGLEIERSGQDFFAHKTGFTQKSLQNALVLAGFPYVFLQLRFLEVRALAFRVAPDQVQREMFALPSLPE